MKLHPVAPLCFAVIESTQDEVSFLAVVGAPAKGASVVDSDDRATVIEVWAQLVGGEEPGNNRVRHGCSVGGWLGNNLATARAFVGLGHVHGASHRPL